jgi:hypothetical protein
MTQLINNDLIKSKDLKSIFDVTYMLLYLIHILKQVSKNHFYQLITFLI